MRLRGTIWLDSVVEKLDRKHALALDEVEQVLRNAPQYRRIERGRVDGEDVYAAYGRTEAGRYVTVVFVRKQGELALVVTARDMDRKERRQYGR